MTLTGLPVRARSEPACAANASGRTICDGDEPTRIARTTTMGSSAATAPLGVMSAVRPPASSMTATSARRLLVPTRPASS